jgi:glycosyltransferase involved in cell wall biosynthesis
VQQQAFPRPDLEIFDRVALHVYPDDVVPLLAFAHRGGLPPVVFVHHSDHTFWLGVGISDLVAQLRQCSVPLSVRRRRIGPERFATLPIPLPPVDRTQSRADARAALGLRADQVVLLSVGTEFKYAPVGGPGFLDVLRPLVEKHEAAVLLVVGPRQKGEWGAAYETTGGRIRALGRRYDTATLFQAADVYLDSFPFTSPTAALEAGSHGLPLVAYCPHTGDARVLSPGAPGLDESIQRRCDPEAYGAAVSALIEGPDLRRQLGERARLAIDHHHRGAAWLDQLAEVYRSASAIAPRGDRPAADRFEPDTIDVYISRLYGVDREGLGQFIDQHVRALPLSARVAVLRRMLRVNRSFSFDLFLPHWCAARLSWRPPYWGSIRKMLAKHDVPPRRPDPCAST